MPSRTRVLQTIDALWANKPDLTLAQLILKAVASKAGDDPQDIVDAMQDTGDAELLALILNSK